MSCRGLHSAGSGRGGSAATLAVIGIVALTAWWAFENLVAVIATVVVSLALSVAVVSWLARVTARREARMGLKLAEWRRIELPRPDRERRAVAGDPHLHLDLHFHGLPDTEAAAAVIRQAISSPAGDRVPVDAVTVEAVAVDAGQHVPALPAGAAHELAVAARQPGRPGQRASVELWLAHTGRNSPPSDGSCSPSRAATAPAWTGPCK